MIEYESVPEKEKDMRIWITFDTFRQQPGPLNPLFSLFVNVKILYYSNYKCYMTLDYDNGLSSFGKYLLHDRWL